MAAAPSAGRVAMYAGLMLLADDATTRLVRGLQATLAPHLPAGRAPGDALAARLPPHLSLKQPFRCEALPPLLRWFCDLAARTPPLTVELTRLTYGEHNGYGVVSIEVAETPPLRALHNQINAELAHVVADPSAPYDGAAYRFHLTVAMEPIGDGNPCRAYYESLADTRLAQRCVATQLALAVHRGATPAPGAFTIEQVAALGLSVG